MFCGRLNYQIKHFWILYLFRTLNDNNNDKINANDNNKCLILGYRVIDEVDCDVECAVQPQPARHLPRHRHGLQQGTILCQTQPS